MRTETATASRGFAAAADFVALGKPRITLLVLITTATGLWLAPGPLAPVRAVLTLIGVALVVAGANALNMYLERDVDALMTRTRNRPLPAGRMAPEIALGTGVMLVAMALPILSVGVNPLTGLLALVSFVLYVCAYTPMKRRSTLALMIGAVPGAMPPLMGWTAATGHLDAPGLGLFLILFVWQLPHFIAISLFRSDEYARAGLKIVPIEHGLSGAKLRILVYSLLQFAASLLIARFGVGGRFYLGAAFALGGVLLALVGYGYKHPSAEHTNRWARWFFLYSLVYLPLLFAALLIGRGG
jgi:protoheme IX farnesyltransferase